MNLQEYSKLGIDDQPLVCVTGASGFLGRAIVQKIAESGDQVLALSREKIDDSEKLRINTTYISGSVEDWIQAIEDSRPKVFISCDWAGVNRSERSNYQQIDNSKRIAILGKVARNIGAETFLAFGSQAEVEPSLNPISECASDSAQNEYGTAKILTREYLSEIFYSGPTRFIWGRVFTVYGPGDTRESLITESIKSRLIHQEIRIANQEKHWSFLYVDDFLAAVILILKNKNVSGIVNIGNSDFTEIGKVAEMISNLPNQIRLINNATAENSTLLEPSWIPETTTLSELYWRPRVDLSSGLLKTYLWWSGKE